MINFEYLKGQLSQFRDKRLKAEISAHIEKRKKMFHTSVLTIMLTAVTLHKIRRGMGTQLVLFPVYCSGLYLTIQKVAEDDRKLLKLLESNADSIPIDFCILLDDVYKY